ncbi:penicillin-binding transpeptidase domain-containing protein [Clostridium sp. JS66]|uniref:penicillin-binding transpeptidase domain-containing protein n=1 Tax=Clostridium sp. JS66 TaxID=3064705 RepID=UPI00298DA229|nr:penicillin-binding transpeptidase domain-containing protein [Clostridium sp. JS66]WPC42887.1 penicillin-binding transpeptidase domain-containing protein [Clostridium sp. JS66]
MEGKKERKFTRYTALIVIMVIIFTAIAGRLFFLQILQGEFYSEKANNKSIREIPEAAPRGNILDKNGSVLAKSVQTYTLVYNQTDESDKHFFDTMGKVFDILDKSGETQKDDFELKINPYSFQFRGDDDKTKRALEIKFKTDRGFADKMKNKLYKNKKGDLTSAEKAKVEEELLKITPEETFKKLVELYKIDDKKYSVDEQRRFMIIKDTLKMNTFSVYKPAVVATNIKQETAFKFYQMLNELPGIDVTREPMRSYPNGELASAVLGYISKIGSSDDKYTEKGYDVSTDYIGQSGIEGAFEDRLKGSKGGEIAKLNKQGRKIEELGKRDPYPGQTIQLTIDKDIQKATEDALDQKMKELRENPSQGSSYTANATRGAAVAIDVNTGAVIALVSRPGFDPNAFAAPGGLSSDLYKQYYPNIADEGKKYIERMGIAGENEEDTLNNLFPVDTSVKGKTIRKDLKDTLPKPLFNYATQSRAMPGSTFKMMTAIAGLETRVITPDFGVDDEMYFDKGGGEAGRVYFRDDGANGWVDLTRAIEKSSNPYFMTVGKMLRTAYDDNILAKYAWKFGLGADPTSNSKKSTGLEIPEAFGQVYNLWSLKNSYAQTYLWKTEEILKAGSDDKGNKCTSIDIYDRDGDSSKVKKIKSDIKTQIQNSIKDGDKAFNKDTYTSLINNLIQEDPQYKDKNISDKEIKAVVNIIYNVTVSDANSQIRAGFSMYDASIGQGIDAFTPVQLANYIATIANGGTRYSVHIVDKFLDADGKLIEQVKPEVAEKTGVKQETLDAVKAGMNAVNEKGTAAEAFKGFTIPTAGKTGTATISNDAQSFGRTDTAVYVGFAPSDTPKIAVCVMIYDGGHGSGAAYVARSMYEAYFKVGSSNSKNTNSNNNDN